MRNNIHIQLLSSRYLHSLQCAQTCQNHQSLIQQNNIYTKTHQLSQKTYFFNKTIKIQKKQNKAHNTAKNNEFRSIML